MSYDEERAYERLVLEHTINGGIIDHAILVFLILYDYKTNHINIKAIRTALEHNLVFSQIKLIKE